MDALIDSSIPSDDQDADESSDWHSTPFSVLKTDPGRVSLKSVLRELEKLSQIETLALPDNLFAEIQPKILRQYRLRAAAEPPREGRRHPEPIRYTLLAAFCWQRRQEIIDGLVDLLIQIVHRISVRAEKKVVDELLGDFQKVYGKTTLLFNLYSAYGRQGWGGRVRQNLPPGHAHFHRRRCLPPWAIKRSAPFAKRPANRPARSPQPLSPLARGRSDHRLVLAQVHPEAPPTPPQRRRRPGPAAPTAPPAAAARAAPGGALAPEADEPSGARPPGRRPPGPAPDGRRHRPGTGASPSAARGPSLRAASPGAAAGVQPTPVSPAVRAVRPSAPRPCPDTPEPPSAAASCATTASPQRAGAPGATGAPPGPGPALRPSSPPPTGGRRGPPRPTGTRQRVRPRVAPGWRPRGSAVPGAPLGGRQGTRPRGGSRAAPGASCRPCCTPAGGPSLASGPPPCGPSPGGAAAPPRWPPCPGAAAPSPASLRRAQAPPGAAPTRAGWGRGGR